MSATGLYSDIYAQLREFGELLDEALMELKAGSGLGDRSNVDELALRFEEMGARDTVGLQAQMLRVVLQERMDRGPGYWTKLGCRLRDEKADDEVVAELERTAAILEHERAGAFAKMRG